MRTTIRVDDDLLAQAKTYAARHRRTLNSVVEDALRMLLARRERRPGPAVDLVAFRGDGLMPGVDLDSSAAMYDLLDDEVAAGYRGHER